MQQAVGNPFKMIKSSNFQFYSTHSTFTNIEVSNHSEYCLVRKVIKLNWSWLWFNFCLLIEMKSYSIVSDLIIKIQQIKSYALVSDLKSKYRVDLKHSDELCSSDFSWNISI